MIRVMLCYPTSFTVNTAWVAWVQAAWEAEHPTEPSTVFPTWEIDPPDLPWEKYRQLSDAVVLVESSVGGKDFLDRRAAQVGRDALVDGKEVWVYRPYPGRKFLRVADIRHDAEGVAKVQVRSLRGKKRKKRRQP
jgi:hypothetical protein